MSKQNSDETYRSCAVVELIEMNYCRVNNVKTGPEWANFSESVGERKMNE